MHAFVFDVTSVALASQNDKENASLIKNTLHLQLCHVPTLKTKLYHSLKIRCSRLDSSLSFSVASQRVIALDLESVRSSCYSRRHDKSEALVGVFVQQLIVLQASLLDHYECTVAGCGYRRPAMQGDGSCKGIMVFSRLLTQARYT
jgi:hypothetical protein